MPRKIQFGNGNKAEYFYDATGVKYKAQWGYAATPQNIPLGATGTEYLSPTGVSRTEYCGNYVYENGILRKIITPEGYVVTNGNVSETVIKMTWYYRYILKDHLGNTRRTLNANALNSTSPTVIPSGQLIDYYPFGLEITRVTNPEGEDYSPPYIAGATTPYLYNGKEIDRMHGLNWYDYGARYYDGATGRWHGVDPLAEKAYDISPYVYCHNNSVNRIDPDGKLDILGGPVLVNGMVKLAKAIAPYTDLNDVVVLGSAVLSTFTDIEPVNIDGTPASGADIEAAKNGLLLPVVSGSGVKKVGDAIDNAMDIGKGSTKGGFVVTPDGIAVPKNQNKMREGFDNAGFQKTNATKTSEKGVIHTVPTKNGKVEVRTMEGSKNHPKRAIITHPGTNNPKTPSGRATSNKNDNHIEQY